MVRKTLNSLKVNAKTKREEDEEQTLIKVRRDSWHPAAASSSLIFPTLGQSNS
jgi:hypothetical protein